MTWAMVTPPFGLERSKVPTPGMTQLAKEGMRFTDAHSIASVCVPSRLAIMTGRYPCALKGSLAAAPWGFIAPRFTPGHHTLAHLLNDADIKPAISVNGTSG